MSRQPYNIGIHGHLTALGYVLRQYEQEVVDIGGLESGPMIRVTPAFDEYVGSDEYIVVDTTGAVVHREDWVEMPEVAA